MTLSVAMATFNGARYIGEQLDSIAAQTVVPSELVITDDASEDETVAIVRDFARTAPFTVHVHENPTRLGFRANFMRAISLCTSELIALCDQDDVWAPTKLAHTAAPFADPDVLLCYHEAWLIDSVGERLGLAHIYPLLERNPPSSANPMRNPYGFAMVIHRRLLAFSDLWAQSVDNLQLHQPMAHDQWLFFLASAFGTVAYVDEPLAGYRQHGSNAYGFVVPGRSLGEKLNQWINVRAKDFACLTIAADSRAAILTQTLDSLDDQGRARAMLAIRHYRQFAAHARWRAAVYDEPGIAGRLAAWRALIRDNGYGNDTRWTFGNKAALIDLACLIPPRRLLGAVARSQRSASSSAVAGAGSTIDGTATPQP
jgi:hypothetical protein